MKVLRVLIADDSAFARRTLGRLVEGMEGVEVVGAVADGVAALREVKAQSPDVLLLDLEMPELDGYGVLRGLRQLPEGPSVIVVSAQSEARNVVRALELGAFDFIAKPGKEATLDLERIVAELHPRLAALRAGARVRPMPIFDADHTPAPPSQAQPRTPAGRVVVIGASTGGPSAILELVSTLPVTFPAAVAIALHMPAGFTLAFAERLGRRGRMPASEAYSGEPLSAGRIVVCPGGQHLTIARAAKGLVCALLPAKDEPWVPSVDRLFESAAPLGNCALGVIFTGMGTDGAKGARVLHDAGGRVLVESAESAIVNGMPAAAIEAGGADAVHPRKGMAAALREWAGK